MKQIKCPVDDHRDNGESGKWLRTLTKSIRAKNEVGLERTNSSLFENTHDPYDLRIQQKFSSGIANGTQNPGIRWFTKAA